MDLIIKNMISVKEVAISSGLGKNPYQGLHDGVVCGVHVGVEWESTFAITVKRSITFRRNDPVLNQGKKKLVILSF